MCSSGLIVARSSEHLIVEASLLSQIPWNQNSNFLKYGDSRATNTSSRSTTPCQTDNPTASSCHSTTETTPNHSTTSSSYCPTSTASIATRPQFDSHYNHIHVIRLSFVPCSLLVLWCFIKKGKKKTAVQETEIINIDEHLKVKEATVEGPRGPKTVVQSVEDDVHVNEIDIKNSKSN
ncbi:hypothetical protein ACH5RR_034128 [Cinchona calisaya]|uniref:Uncharacterized protein n=1 Tax=Cinchona calisaya TaxID=153742 RepID=A0ABD2YEK0_9GENT